MAGTRNVASTIRQLARCPRCTGRLDWDLHSASCVDTNCGSRFPIVGGVPILIDESRSLFRIEDFEVQRPTFFQFENKSRAINSIKRFLPTLSANVKGKSNYRSLAQLLHHRAIEPIVLVIGASDLGEGMKEFAEQEVITLIESDVAIGPRTTVVCDAHDIPFEDASFDAVIVQAVLEHVVDPYRCVAQIHRVLKQDGLVYAETPFIQQVHGGPWDFTRFTHLGHRRLFRYFDEVDSGAVCGPGMALAWTYEHFLLSFARSRWTRRLLRTFALLTAFWLKYLDPLLIDRPATLDAASGYYFLGRRSDDPISDQEIVRSYRGAVGIDI